MRVKVTTGEDWLFQLVMLNWRHWELCFLAPLLNVINPLDEDIFMETDFFVVFGVQAFMNQWNLMSCSLIEPLSMITGQTLTSLPLAGKHSPAQCGHTLTVWTTTKLSAATTGPIRIAISPSDGPSVLNETHVVGTVFRLFCKREISAATILIFALMILPLSLRGHWGQTDLSGAITHWRKSDGLICLVHSEHLSCLCLRI